jgi:hypothetical protein
LTGYADVDVLQVVDPGAEDFNGSFTVVRHYFPPSGCCVLKLR